MTNEASYREPNDAVHFCEGNSVSGHLWITRLRKMSVLRWNLFGKRFSY